MEMYRAPPGAEDFGALVLASRPHYPATGLGPPASQHTTALVVGGWGHRDKTYVDDASLIDSDSFRVFMSFP